MLVYVMLEHLATSVVTLVSVLFGGSIPTFSSLCKKIDVGSIHHTSGYKLTCVLKKRKNIFKMNKKVGMLLQKYLMQVE